jgi:hypothetical protein
MFPTHVKTRQSGTRLHSNFASKDLASSKSCTQNAKFL